MGVGGIGMSGIAELLANLGYEVSGSDARRSEVTTRLEHVCGVRIHEGHRAEHVGAADVVVYSSAVRPSNPELTEAARRGIPAIPRAEMLAELMRLRFSIAVAGSHGKTTTTSMIAVVLERAGLDPTAVIGGRLSAFGSNARLGGGEYLVAEADESDRSFLLLSPTVAVMTNIDHEHMDTYGSVEQLEQAFADFGDKVPFYGAAVVCSDDARAAHVASRLKRRTVTYGLGDGGRVPDVRGTDGALGSFGGRCTVSRRQADGTYAHLGTIELSIPGRHNLQNALAAVAVADDLGVPFDVVASALAGFRGAERRFERFGEHAGVLVVDDYGHHPTEIAAVLAAARATLDRRLVVAFQPHRYSRTRQLMQEFGPSLREADEIVLADIYAAGEEPLPGVTLDTLGAAIREGSGRPVHLVRALDDIVPTVLGLVHAGDAVITLGAGSIGTVPRRLVAALEGRGGGR